MCGIAAFVGETTAERAGALVRAVAEAQAHRGPDDEGVAVVCAAGAMVALGSRRLAIQDLSPHGHQPMQSPETGDLLVYNGEIYNAPELRRELEAQGCAFTGRSDTEVLLRAYQQWGTGCLDRLRGMFAFALWDARRVRLIIARDPLGIKPLYYAGKPGEWFICASEVGALMRSGLVEPQISRAALAGYLAYGAVQEPLAIYENVFALPRATWRELDARGRVLAEGIYWRPPSLNGQRGNGHHRAPLEEGRALLEQSVRRHLLSDVRVGIFLSSGLDSTAILGIARSASEHLNAFTVSFADDPKYDEAAVARATAARFGVQYHEYPIGESTALAWVRDGLECMDQPAMDGLNTYMVARAVREQGIAVALSGLGGDEIFGGYNTFRRVQRLARASSWVSAMPASWRVAAAWALTAAGGEVVRRKAKDLARCGGGVARIYFHLRRLLADDDLELLGLDAEGVALTPDYQRSDLASGCVLDLDPVASVGRLESSFYLQNVLLRDADIYGMANSLEIRVPLLDRDLVDWALRLPGEVLLPSRAPSKHLLRMMCADLYGRSHGRQAKRGFAPPFSRWLMGPLRSLMEDTLEEVKYSGHVAPQGVEPLKRMFLRQPNTPAWSRVWALVTLGHWLRTHKSQAVVH